LLEIIGGVAVSVAGGGLLIAGSIYYGVRLYKESIIE
jgi:hypothetical protein